MEKRRIFRIQSRLYRRSPSARQHRPGFLFPLPDFRRPVTQLHQVVILILRRRRRQILRLEPRIKVWWSTLRFKELHPTFQQTQIEPRSFRNYLNRKLLFTDFRRRQHIGRHLRRPLLVHLKMLVLFKHLALGTLAVDHCLARLVLAVNLLINQGNVQQFRHVRGLILKIRRTGEHSHQGIIIPRLNGIEFMIMATCARNGQPQKRSARDVDLFIPNVHDHLALVRLRQRLRPQSQKPRSHYAPRINGLPRRRRHQVPSHLLAHELVIGHIAVERVDHIVAIAPRVGIPVIFIVASRVRITRHIQPVPPPLLAITRRREQAIHNLLISRR